jgi:hypothetical protein
MAGVLRDEREQLDAVWEVLAPVVVKGRLTASRWSPRRPERLVSAKAGALRSGLLHDRCQLVSPSSFQLRASAGLGLHRPPL